MKRHLLVKNSGWSPRGCCSRIAVTLQRRGWLAKTTENALKYSASKVEHCNLPFIKHQQEVDFSPNKLPYEN